MTTYVFDVGETLVDESRHWLRVATELGVPAFTFLGVFGEVIAAGLDHREVFVRFGTTAEAFHAEVDARNDPADGLLPTDLYPDALPALRGLVNVGHVVALAGNQPLRAERVLSEFGLPVSFIATSAGWGVAKPSPEFFAKVIEVADVAPASIVYVGDRLDNDVLPAKAAGLTAILIRRGPWGHLHALRPEASKADRIIDSLTELFNENPNGYDRAAR